MTETVLDYMTRLGRAAREASRQLARARTAQKNHALLAAAEALDAEREALRVAAAEAGAAEAAQASFYNAGYTPSYAAAASYADGSGLAAPR